MEREPIARMTAEALQALTPEQMATFILGDNFSHDTLSRGAALNLYRDILDCLHAALRAEREQTRERCAQAAQVAGADEDISVYALDRIVAAVRTID